MITEASLQKVRDEATLLRNLRHPNICSFFGTCYVPPDPAMVLPGAGSVHTLPPLAESKDAAQPSLRVPALVLEYLAGGTLSAALGLYDAPDSSSRTESTNHFNSWSGSALLPPINSAKSLSAEQAARASQKHDQMSSQLLLRLAADVASGLHFLHTHSIVHCDVKCAKCVPATLAKHE